MPETEEVTTPAVPLKETITNPKSVGKGGFDPGFDDRAELAKNMEFPLCPTVQELAERSKSAAKLLLHQARRARREGKKIEARLFFEEAVIRQKMAQRMYDRHYDMIRKVRG